MHFGTQAELIGLGRGHRMRVGRAGRRRQGCVRQNVAWQGQYTLLLFLLLLLKTVSLRLEEVAHL